MKEDEYKCSSCLEVFKLVRDENWSNEHAVEEFENSFGRKKTEDDAIVCDDCYKKIMAFNTVNISAGIVRSK